MNDNSIASRVTQGAALLDERAPGWADRIDLDRLDLASPCRCVLGQTWDESWDEREGDNPFDLHSRRLFGHLKIDQYYSEQEFGFNALDGTEREMKGEYAALTAQWRRVILARRGGAK